MFLSLNIYIEFKSQGNRQQEIQKYFYVPVKPKSCFSKQAMHIFLEEIIFRRNWIRCQKQR